MSDQPQQDERQTLGFSVFSKLWLRSFWHSIFNLIEPSDGLTDPYERHIVRLYHSLLILFAPLALVLSLLHSYLDGQVDGGWDTESLIVGSLGILTIVGLYWFSRSGYHRSAFRVTLVLGSALIIGIASISSPPHQEILFLLILPLLSSVILTLRDTIIVSAIMTFIILFWLRFVLQVQDADIITDFGTIFVILTAFIVFTSYQRNRLEEERRAVITQNETQLRMLMNQLPVTIWTTDNNLVVQSMSGTNITSRPATLIQQSLPEIIRQRQAENTGIVKAHQRALQGESVSYEVEWQERTLQTYIEPLRDLSNTVIGTIGVATDISQRKRNEQNRLTVATQKERINVLQNFIEVASHDFKTPISTIITSLYVARRKLEQNEDIIPYLERIEIQTQRILDVLDSMLTMNQLDTHQLRPLKPTNLSVLLADIYQAYAPKIQAKSLEFRRDIVPDILIYMDAKSMDLAISQVLDNALRFTDDGFIRLSLVPDNSNARIEIEDSGIGMTIRQKKRIFERFYRGEEARPQDGGTTGLGLSVARKIITDHGGTIDVDSETGVGTTFTIQLHRIQQEKSSPSTAETLESDQTRVHPHNPDSSLARS